MMSIPDKGVRENGWGILGMKVQELFQLLIFA